MDEVELDYVGGEEDLDQEAGYSYKPHSLQEKIKEFFFSPSGIKFLVIVVLVVLIGCALFAAQLAIGKFVMHHTETQTNPEDNTTPTSNTNDDSDTPAPAPSPSAVPQSLQKFWIDLAAEIHSAMDHSVDPCDDFYQYACGGWLAVTEIPPDKSAYGKSFTTIQDENDKIIDKILNAGWPMISTLYDDCMNTDLRNQLGNLPLIPWIKLVDEMSAESFAVVLGQLHHFGLVGVFDFDVSPDLLDPTVNRFEVDQGGLGLPSKNYYGESPYYADIQQAYKHRISSTLGLIQDIISQPDSETALPLDQQAENIFAFELQMANISKSPVERRDIEALYNPTSRSDFLRRYHYFDWEAYFAQIRLDPSVQTLNVIVPEFFSGLENVLASVSLPVLKNYLRWTISLSSSKLLSQDFYDVYFAYLSVMYGIDQPPAQSKTCASAVNQILGMLVGRYFIQEAWSEASQQQAEDLITAIKNSFNTDLRSVSWMDATTRTAALGKLDAVNNKVGHPTEWPSYSKLYLYANEYYNNTLEGWKYEIENMIAEADKPVDKQKWDMYPQTVNAYYDPQLNEMVFPAAILQEPFFNELYPHPVSYGGIGAVMGHELTHGFDDQGRQFDATGAYRQWWTQYSIDNFNTQAECVVELYNQYEVEPGLFVDGEQTEGENLADMGGVKDAYRAMKTAMASVDPLVAETIENIFGMSVDKLFFLSYGQVWCEAIKPEYAALLVNVDVHSPARARVLNPLSQFETFAEVYQCPANSPMNPQSRCSVW